MVEALSTEFIQRFNSKLPVAQSNQNNQDDEQSCGKNWDEIWTRKLKSTASNSTAEVSNYSASKSE
jgi:hypothetical protein